MLDQRRAFIGGEWREANSGLTFDVVNPYSGALISSVANCGAEETEEAIGKASEAFKTWRKTTINQRAAILRKIGDLVLQNKAELGAILTKEQGKPKGEAEGEVGFAASFFHFFAEECRRPCGEVFSPTAHGKQFITVREPLGVAAMVCPWNFPIGMPARKVAAALAAGCTCVVKPAEDTPFTTLALAAICEKAGVPAGVVNVIPCSREKVAEVGKKMCQDPRVSIVSFTGSCAVGKKLYADCGDTVKRVALELGGNAPFIVFKSADLDKAVAGLMGAKFRNAGQTCVTANRILVQEEIFPAFLSKFRKAVEDLKVGDGEKAGTTIGPIINSRQLERVERIVKESVAVGAKVEIGGISQGPCYMPTILTGVNVDMACWAEEIFGPVASLRKFATEEEAVAEANDCDRGLAAYLFTTDYSQAWRVSSALESGMVGVNDVAISTPETPFGGYKTSGIGKEGSRHGLEEYSNLKLIDMGGL